MGAEQTISLVQRKARTGSEAQAARAMSLGRALRVTAAKQADQMMALALGVLGVTRCTVTAGDMVARLDTDALILLMDGPGVQVAAAVLEQTVVSGLIQQQTMGRIAPAVEGAAPRHFTATDAALCAPFVETLMGQAAPLPEDEADRTLIAGYRFGVWAQEARQAQLALEASAYEVVEMTLDLAGGARTGKLTLIMPEPEPVVEPVTEEGIETQDKAVKTGGLADIALGLHAELGIALTRVKLSLQQASALKPGDLLDLNVSTMAQALVIDVNGKVLSRGTLGQIDGMRAVQVEQQKTREHHQPRRRASDRDDLDLPDVTQPDARSYRPLPETEAPDDGVPNMSDVDIFGSLEALPDMIESEHEASHDEAQSDPWSAEDGAEHTRQKQVVW
tara:strand:+ start:315 stop:1487 length:1173 start_codon:yes stop_codon:yes gene_type:complete